MTEVGIIGQFWGTVPDARNRDPHIKNGLMSHPTTVCACVCVYMGGKYQNPLGKRVINIPRVVQANVLIFVAFFVTAADWSIHFKSFINP